ncbi:hypothetical protein ACFX1X_046186 [Malus domestica]
MQFYVPFHLLLYSTNQWIFCDLGLTSSIVLRSRRLSDLIAQLQDILKGVHEADVLPEKFDSAVIRAQIPFIISDTDVLSRSIGDKCYKFH